MNYVTLKIQFSLQASPVSTHTDMTKLSACQKNAGRQMAFQLYIIDNHAYDYCLLYSSGYNMYFTYTLLHKRKLQWMKQVLIIAVSDH